MTVLAMLVLFATTAYAAGGRGGGGSGHGGEHDDATITVEEALAEIDTSWTIHEIAELTGIPGSAWAHEFLLATDVDKNTPISELGVSQEELEKAIRHSLGEHEGGYSDLKYILYALISVFAAIWLLWLGKSKDRTLAGRRKWYPRWVYYGVLGLSVLVLGFILGKSPNPMEAVVKVPKAMVGLYESVGPYVLWMGFFLLLAFIANKVVCGWACPFGALEELIYSLPFFKKAKKIKLPFWITNTVRGLLFLVFLLLMWGLLFAPKGFVIFHYLNPFNMFDIFRGPIETTVIVVAIVVYLIVSFFFYRPFCRFICPFGFLSWIVERVSLSKIKIDRKACIDCRACVNACPLTAAKDRLDKSALPADCFACMKCLRVCPTDAIDWKWAWDKNGGQQA